MYLLEDQLGDFLGCIFLSEHLGLLGNKQSR
uniref:Uncharacterized protein n=1 Tax=Arundo donax TaxID=35708 RepID=A0A0A9D0N6_ARUDO